ncbi:MAG: PQQ-binding-like beta-propeller repeat protein [Pseudomonadales bacterium]|nr:PQQ-binding-like beta-propeller repeat protein [Pseudomonadales bacterium]
MTGHGLLTALLLSLLLVMPVAAQTGTPVPPADTFQNACARCHIPIELEYRLRRDWLGRRAGELYQQLKTSMPADNPGSLSAAQYLELSTQVLRLAGVAVPQRVLTLAELDDVIIRMADPADQAVPSVPWQHYNGDLAARRYSPLDQITADNAGQLQEAWFFSTANFGPRAEALNLTSPLMVNDTLYLTAGVQRDIVALDPGSGQLLWLWRPQEGERFDKAPRKGSGKGLAYWSDGAQEVIFTVTPGYFLVALNARTGLPVESFGAGGWVDLQAGLRTGPGREDLDIGLSFPPLVVDDVVIVGASHLISMRPVSAANVKGDIRAYDAHSGELLWTFHTIPAPGEEGYDSWLENSADYTGNAGVWAPMSADPELGLVYLPVEAATGDHYGGDRPGANLFANSLVALDYRSGEKKWHYQIIHHDIWDWDNPSAPILADLPDGRKVVVQLTKQAMAYVFDRETGVPVWNIEEKPVPQSDVPGEWSSPTQPIPSRPAPYDRQGFSESDLNDFTPELLAKAKAVIKPYRGGPLYTPPSLAQAPDGTIGTLSMPSATGGSNWEGGAYDPESGILYVPSRTAVSIMAMVPGGEASTVRYIQGGGAALNVDGLPLVKPPWGRITAIDLNSGEQLWQIANADTPPEVARHPALAGITLPRTGVPTRAGLLLTPTLLFAGEGIGGGPVLRAHDKKTGEIIAELSLPGTQTGTPVSYLYRGRQYLVMAVSAGGSSGLVALALPDSGTP